MAEFRELSDHHLNGLTDEQLIDYLCRAREAGHPNAMKPAVAVLVYGYWDTLVARARLRLPTSDAEDVAAEAAASAIAAAFDGKSLGEFRTLLHTILSRRIADYFEARKRRPPTTELPSEHRGEEDVWGDEPAVGFEGDGIHARECLARAYKDLEADHHRRVIDLYLFGPHSAADTAASVGAEMTEDNVHQISSRFQKRARELLDEGDTST